jgi:hypothetical protein
MSKNFLASLCLGGALVMFVVCFGAFPNSVSASSGEPAESCSGGCNSLNDGSCTPGGNCSGSVDGISCGCHTVTQATGPNVGENTCVCNAGYNGNT